MQSEHAVGHCNSQQNSDIFSYFLIVLYKPHIFVSTLFANIPLMRHSYNWVNFAGASSGIGAATAKVFTKLGASLALTGRNEENLKRVGDEFKSYSRKQVTCIYCTLYAQLYLFMLSVFCFVFCFAHISEVFTLSLLVCGYILTGWIQVTCHHLVNDKEVTSRSQKFC